MAVTVFDRVDVSFIPSPEVIVTGRVNSPFEAQATADPEDFPVPLVDMTMELVEARLSLQPVPRSSALREATQPSFAGVAGAKLGVTRSSMNVSNALCPRFWAISVCEACTARAPSVPLGSREIVVL